jgi:hypothetical protein
MGSEMPELRSEPLRSEAESGGQILYEIPTQRLSISWRDSDQPPGEAIERKATPIAKRS